MTDTTSCPIVPLFPLPKLLLFPGTILPLHIFEPRYRQMVEDMLDGPGRLVLGTVLPGHEDDLAGSPPVHPIAGLGEIGRHERLPDGRFLILVVGLSRVQIDEVDSDRMYRKVEARTLREVPATTSDEDELKPPVLEALRERSKIGKTPIEQLPFERLVDLLLLHLQLPGDDMLELYGETDVTARARRVLEEHRRKPARRSSPPFKMELDDEVPEDDEP